MIRLALLVAFAATPAFADPCKAIPDRGPMPSYLTRGAVFSGQVVYVGDGDGMCVAAQPGGPSGWVEVRLSDFYAAELNAPDGRAAKSALERIAKGKRAVCVASHRSHDRIVAACTINGRPVGDLMRRAGIAEGGNGR